MINEPFCICFSCLLAFSSLSDLALYFIFLSLAFSLVVSWDARTHPQPGDLGHEGVSWFLSLWPRQPSRVSVLFPPPDLFVLCFGAEQFLQHIKPSSSPWKQDQLKMGSSITLKWPAWLKTGYFGYSRSGVTVPVAWCKSGLQPLLAPVLGSLVVLATEAALTAVQM